MKGIVYLITVLSFICSCNSKHDPAIHGQKFDKIKWQTKETDAYIFRPEMLDDLIKNVPLKGLKKVELINLLGQPDRTDNDYLFYRISQKRVVGFPLSTKTLVIKLTRDSTVEWRKIHGG